MKRVMIVATLLLFLGPNMIKNQEHAVKYAPSKKVSSREPSREKLLYAIAKVESNFNAKAVSYKGARGVMQIMPAVWERELKKVGIIKHRDELFDYYTSMAAGNYILDKLFEQYKGDLDKVLHHYSGGAKGYKQKVYRHMAIME